MLNYIKISAKSKNVKAKRAKGEKIMRVIGKQFGSFKDKDTGNTINYCKLHVSAKDEKVGEGEAVEALSIKTDLVDKVKQLKIGDEIAVSYNKWGKPENITVIEQQLRQKM